MPVADCKTLVMSMPNDWYKQKLEQRYRKHENEDSIKENESEIKTIIAKMKNTLQKN